MALEPGDNQTGATWRTETVEGSSALTRSVVLVDGRPASREEFFEGLSRSGSCRDALTRCLVELANEQIYWETPPLSRSNADSAAEFVTVEASGLRREPDPAAFRQHFAPGELEARFPNLGGNAVLVCPTELSDGERYNYLLSFLRSGTAAQIHAVWSAVGHEALARLGDAPIWVSTSGGGVPWLHYRIESTPKYYSHAPYRQYP